MNLEPVKARPPIMDECEECGTDAGWAHDVACSVGRIRFDSADITLERHDAQLSLVLEELGKHMPTQCQPHCSLSVHVCNVCGEKSPCWAAELREKLEEA